MILVTTGNFFLFQAVVRYHYSQTRNSPSEVLWKSSPIVRARTVFSVGGKKEAEDQQTLGLN
jgi:hypothetical protein